MRFGDRNCPCGKSPNSLCVANVCDHSVTLACQQPFDFPACSSRFMHVVQAFVCTYSQHDCCNISCALEIPQVSLHAMFQFSYRRVAVTSSDRCLTAVDRALPDRQCGCLLQIMSYMIGFTIVQQGCLGDLHMRAASRIKIASERMLREPFYSIVHA
jgi:hypothetical protein